MKIGRKLKRQIGFLMSVLCSISLVACGTKYADAPALLEPVSGTESYREVSVGDVGTLKVVYGSIVPTEHAVFWTTQVEVAEIAVDVGDYVTAGQVVATADLDAAAKTKAGLEESKNLLVKKHELESEKKKYLIQKLNLQQAGENQLGDAESAAATGKEIATEQENMNYDELLYEHQLADYDEQIQKQQDIIEDGTLKATVSGYVSYVRQFTDSNQVTGSQNVVVIADYENTYIEVQGTTIKDKLLEKYDRYYTIQNGQKVPLREYAYTVQERLASENQQKYPALRMQYEDIAKSASIGSVIPVYLVRDREENVLYVGNDSLYEDDQGTFVYVKNGDQREQRYIETGVSDTVNTEVVSGLSEGEKVYYTSESAWPDAYTEYTVSASKNYDAMFYTSRYAIADTTRVNYVSSYEGSIQEVCVANGDYVQKGDVLLKVRTNEGSARLAEMRMGIEDMKESRTKSVQAHEETLQTLQQQKQAATSGVQSPVATDTDAQTATDGDAQKKANPNLSSMLDVDIQMEILDFQIQTLEYEYQLKQAEDAYTQASCNNDGTGVMSVCARQEGEVQNFWMDVGYKIEVNSNILSIDSPVKSKMALYGGSTKVAIGTPVSVQEEESGKIIQGIVCGSNGIADGTAEDYYVTTVDEKVYITQSLTSDSKMYYVMLDGDISVDDIKGSQMISYPLISYSDVYTIPVDALYTEKVNSQKETSGTLYYVWKIVDGNIEKQYVEAAISNATQDTAKYQKGKAMACIFSGLNEGDVIAGPVEEEE